jgi:outer membrane protein assembly factor BamB
MRRSQLTRIITLTAMVALVLPLAPTAHAADWPGWRGPNRDGRSPENGLLDAWPEGGPPLLWRVDGLGSGYSSLAVVGDRVYTLGDHGDTQHAMALSRETGEVLWKTPLGPAHEDKYLGARSTPTVDGARVYVMSTEGMLWCLNSKTGAPMWKRSLPDDFGGTMMKAQGTYSWKWAESPLVDGERVIVTPGGPKAAMVALDKRKGNEIWRAEVPALGDAGADGAGYSSVVVSHGAGVKQYVQLMGRGAVGIDAETGAFLWGYNRVANDVANIPTPLVDGDHVFVSSGYGTGAALLRLKKTEGGVAAEEVYFLTGDTFQNHHGGLILDDGVVYTGTGHNKGFPLALRMGSGEIAWGPIRNEGQGSAAVSFADDKLFMRYQDGLMVLVEATPAGYREKGSFEIPDVNQFSWSHPVIAGGKLWLREQDDLFVYDVADGAAERAAARAKEQATKAEPGR